ncbi:MAG: DUF4097 family beta strand repeat-containing protein [Ginsengibacter sp.]
MKKYFSVLLFANICLAVNAQNKSDKEPYLTKSLSGETVNSVRAETSGGNISVTGGNQSDSRVEVFIWQNGNKLKALSGDELKVKVDEDYDLDVSVKDSKLTVTAKPKHRITDWKKALNFSFRIYVARNVTTGLETSGGNIELAGLSGNQEFTTSGGNLALKDLDGKIKGRTSGGNISFRDLKDDVDLTTSGGNIQAENSSGSINISTSGGSIELSGLKGNIKASTSGGNIGGETIEGDLSAHTSGGNVSLHGLNCGLKAGTSGGNIDVSVASIVKDISINNAAGNVNLTIPRNKGIDLKLYANRISTETLQDFKGKNTKEEINGTLSGGGIPVKVDAGGGKINLEFN